MGPRAGGCVPGKLGPATAFYEAWDGEIRFEPIRVTWGP
jgi:hypothetical protein